MISTDPAVLVLEDGTRYPGRAYGARGRTLGEAVFATGMTGYQETLTDPSYAGQIVIMTAPHIGNTGMNDEDPESRRIWVSGYVVRDPSRVVSRTSARSGAWTTNSPRTASSASAASTPAPSPVDCATPAPCAAGVFSGPDAALSARRAARDRAQQPPRWRGSTSRRRSRSTPSGHARCPPTASDSAPSRCSTWASRSRRIDNLAARGFDVHVLPQSSRSSRCSPSQPDAAFFSNGPGDPEASDEHVALLQGILRAGLPFFGICFGNQLLGRALGLGTYKLPFGHRGINQPVLDKAHRPGRDHGHNHGFAVDAPIDGVIDRPPASAASR